jgi:signal transduction histidine kinase
VVAAREKLRDAENAEKEADRALALARRAVLDAREHCAHLETQAIEEYV